MRRCRQSVGLRSKCKAAARALELATACIGAWLVAATPALAQGSDARIVIDADRPGAKIDPNIYDRGSLTLSLSRSSTWTPTATCASAPTCTGSWRAGGPRG